MRRDDTLRAADGAELSLARWETRNPRGIVCGLHGLGEHARRYEHVARAWNERGFSFRMADLRGHGGTPGKRGDILYAQAAQDALTLLSSAREDALSVVLYGHSLGGGLALHLMTTHPLPIVCGVVTSPWLLLKRPTGKPLVAALAVLRKVAPRFVFSNGLSADGLSHDQGVRDGYMNDPLVHDRVSFDLAHGAYRAGIASLQNAGSLAVPLALLHGADDPVCDVEGSRKFAQSAGGLCTYHEFPGMFHELHNEQVWPDAFERQAAFVEAALAGRRG